MNARNSLVGAGIGAGLMFLLDPARGNRRRALIRDKMIYAVRKTRDTAGAARRDVGNRLYGMTRQPAMLACVLERRRRRYSPPGVASRLDGIAQSPSTGNRPDCASSVCGGA